MCNRAGIGEMTARQLVAHGLRTCTLQLAALFHSNSSAVRCLAQTVEDLRPFADILLSPAQRIGLQLFDDFEQRIPVPLSLFALYAEQSVFATRLRSARRWRRLRSIC